MKINNILPKIKCSTISYFGLGLGLEKNTSTNIIVLLIPFVMIEIYIPKKSEKEL